MATNILRYLFIGSIAAALCIAAAIPFVLWGNDKAPEFYGAFTAAIVAAIAVILGSYYQAELTRRRDDLLRNQETTAQAIDLCFWLDHAANELDFIVSVLKPTRDTLAANAKPHLDMPLKQFREVTSSKFFDELLDRAKSATRLPPEIAGTVVQTIYRTFHVADRALLLRGASDTYQPSLDHMDRLLFVLNRRAEKLREASTVIEHYLNGVGSLPPIENDE